MKEFDPFNPTATPTAPTQPTQHPQNPFQQFDAHASTAPTEPLYSPYHGFPPVDASAVATASAALMTSPSGESAPAQAAAPPKSPRSKKVPLTIVLLGGFAVIAIVAVVLVGGLASGSTPSPDPTSPIANLPQSPGEPDSDTSAAPTTPDSEDSTNTTTPADRKSLTTMEIADKVMPSVVGVVVYEKDDQGNLVEAGEGSGIILSKDGYIATNAHVVLGEATLTAQGRSQGAAQIEVYFEGGDYVTATLVGADPRTDLALLKVQHDGLVPATIGDSSALRIGEKAVAIGNPTGRMLSGSLTQGVISGLDRTISMGENSYTMNYIQTDAAISPGNSGGALANTYGEVVGVNTSKIAAAAYEGIGFAIPMHEAMPILDNLKENGYVAGRPRIGITFTPITPDMAELFDIPSGLRVVDVDPIVDAYKKGLQPGSIITHLDGQEVALLDDVASLLVDKKPGDTVTLTVMQRNKNNQVKEQKIEVKLAQDLTSKPVE